MMLQRALREYLRQHFPAALREEPWCSCGTANHARLVLFRVNGQPTTAIVPEGCELTAVQMRRALPEAHVDPLAAEELDAVYADGELGHMLPFENPFGANIYLDQNLLQFETLVVCPRMFGGRKGECFRVSTREFQTLLHPLVLPLFPAFIPAPEP